ncbi:hypothetical protein U91I_04101 [alpha proteobacterium U9-1i]|nr:hypothetical protein U91I_04101 [alpha proteobacterium U9-1i]
MRALSIASVLALALFACSPAEDAKAPEAAPVAQPAAAAPALPAIDPPWDGARAAGVDFRAVGQEPGWLLDIYTQDRIVLAWNYAQSRAAFPLTPPQSPQEGATRYETQADGHTLVITTRRAPCQDVMSGENFPATVEIVIDGTTLQGCGRSA